MLINFIFLLIALVVLVWSANRFVHAAAVIAKLLKISPFIIGVVLLGFGTSLPEMLVSTFSAAAGKPEIALGNVYGSNIANIALILGLVGFLRPLPMTRKNLIHDLPMLLAVMGLTALLIYDNYLSRFDALILLVTFTAIMLYTIYREPKHIAIEEVESEIGAVKWSGKKAIFWAIAGLLLLVGSSELLVISAVNIARELGVSELLIGLTIVALGTSLPELSAAIAANRQGQNELVTGNIFGSILFNTTIVVGIAGMISPLNVVEEILSRDFPVMIIVTVILFLFSCNWRRTHCGRISRLDGIFLMILYLAYNAYLIVQSVR